MTKNQLFVLVVVLGFLLSFPFVGALAQMTAPVASVSVAKVIRGGGRAGVSLDSRVVVVVSGPAGAVSYEASLSQFEEATLKIAKSNKSALGYAVLAAVATDVAGDACAVFHFDSDLAFVGADLVKHGWDRDPTQALPMMKAAFVEVGHATKFAALLGGSPVASGY